MSVLFKDRIKVENLSENLDERISQVFIGLSENYAVRKVGQNIEITVCPTSMGALIGYKGNNLKEISKYFWNKVCRAVPPIVLVCYKDEIVTEPYAKMVQLSRMEKGSAIVVNNDMIKKSRHISKYSIFSNREQGWISQWEALSMGIPYSAIKKYKELRQ